MGVYSNLALQEVAKTNGNGSAAQFMIETHRFDLSLFNAVIECDFASALNEAGIISLTEADKSEANKVRKEGIIKRIVEAIKKAYNFIMGKVNDLINVIKDLVNKDKKLYVTFADKITPESIKGCPIKGKVPYDNKMGELIDEIDDTEFDVSDVFINIDKVSDASDISSIVTDYKEKIGKLIEKISSKEAINNFFNIEDKPVAEKMTDIDIRSMKNAVQYGYKNYIKRFQLLCNTNKNYLDITKREIEKSKKETKDEFEINKLNAKAQCVSYIINYVTKLSAFGLVVVKEMIKSYRRIFAQLGSYVTNKASSEEEATTEAYAVEMFSDEVVEEAFAAARV